jgi:hypothetical protein
MCDEPQAAQPTRLRRGTALAVLSQSTNQVPLPVTPLPLRIPSALRRNPSFSTFPQRAQLYPSSSAHLVHLPAMPLLSMFPKPPTLAVAGPSRFHYLVTLATQ